MRLLKTSLALFVIASVSISCSGVKNVEMRADGGTLKFRKRGLTKDHREDNTYSKADEHCKQNGFKTYKIESEVEDGRFMVVRFNCIN